MKHLSINSLCVVLTCSLVASPAYAVHQEGSRARPQASASDQNTSDTDKARLRFERGVELYESGDVEAAFIEFKRAYELVPNYHLLFNIAQAQAELKDYVGALDSLDQYLKDGGSKISAARRIAVHEEVKRLKTYVAYVRLKLEVKDAQVKVDGKVVDFRASLGEIAVSAGRRKVEVLHKDYLPWERYIDVAGEDNLKLDVDLVARPKVTNAIVTQKGVGSAAGQMQQRRVGPLFWSGVAATATFGIGTIVLGSLAMRAQGRHDELLRSFPTSQPAVDQSAKDVKGLALATDIGLIITTGAAAFTVVSYFWGNKKKREQGGIKAAVSPGAVWLGGRF